MELHAGSVWVDAVVAMYQDAARISPMHLSLTEGICQAWVWPQYIEWIDTL